MRNLHSALAARLGSSQAEPRYLVPTWPDFTSVGDKGRTACRVSRRISALADDACLTGNEQIAKEGRSKDESQKNQHGVGYCSQRWLLLLGVIANGQVTNILAVGRIAHSELFDGPAASKHKYQITLRRRYAN